MNYSGVSRLYVSSAVPWLMRTYLCNINNIKKKLCIGGIEEGVPDKVCAIAYYFICLYITPYFCKDLIVQV